MGAEGGGNQALTYFPAPSFQVPSRQGCDHFLRFKEAMRTPALAQPPRRAGGKPAADHITEEALSHFSAAEIPFFPHGSGRASSPLFSEDG